jgi:hypothetical protein
VIYFVPVYSWPGVPGAATPGVLVDPPAETPATAPTRSPVPEPAPLAVPPATPAAPAAPPIPRKPFYFIEGCYLGDVPPAAAKLPASCDPAKATIFWP